MDHFVSTVFRCSILLPNSIEISLCCLPDLCVWLSMATKSKYNACLRTDYTHGLVLGIKHTENFHYSCTWKIACMIQLWKIDYHKYCISTVLATNAVEVYEEPCRKSEKNMALFKIWNSLKNMQYILSIGVLQVYGFTQFYRWSYITSDISTMNLLAWVVCITFIRWVETDLNSCR